MNRLAIALALAFAGLLPGCASQQAPGHVLTGGTRIGSEGAAAPLPTVAPRQVYVQDFGLEADATEPKSGPLGRPRLLQQITSDDPATHARKIVNAMANALTNDLVAAGVPAQRLAPGSPLPAEGWLIRGVFTEADTGNSLRRAVIGLGSGATDMEVQVGVSDLSADPNASFIVFGTVTDPSRLPGGVVTRNPYVVAAKFVLSKGAPERDIQRTAKTIADELVKFRNQVRAGQVPMPATR